MTNPETENAGVIALPGIPVRLQRLIAWALLAAATCWGLFNVYRYSVNIPWEDEWDIFQTAGQEWTQWFQGHNEHKIVFTRILNDVFYRLNGLNVRSLILFDQVLYLGTAAVILCAFHASLRKFVWYPVFFIPFFSDAVSINMLWSNQNQFHFLLLFAFGALIFGFQKKSSPWNALFFSVFLMLDVFSMSFNFALPLLLAYWIKEWMLFRAAKDGTRRHLFTCCLLPLLFFSAAVWVLLTWQTNAALTGDRSFLYPWHPKFWLYTVLSIYRIFSGTGRAHPGYGLPAFCFFTLPLLFSAHGFLTLCRKRRTAPDFWFLGACLLMNVCTLCIIESARQSWISERHTEAFLSLFPLIPAILLTAPLALKNQKRLLLCYVTGILLTLPYTMKFTNAAQFYSKRTAGIRQLEQAVRERRQPLLIKDLYPQDLSELYQRLRTKNFSWLTTGLR